MEGICSNCQGIKGEDGLTGYYIYNAYDEDYKEFIVCELCGGTGISNTQVQNLTLSQLEFLMMRDSNA